MTEKAKNYFEELSEINVSDKIEKKNGLSYLSWAWAWQELKKRFPAAEKKVIKNENGWLYHTDGKTCWVEVCVILRDIVNGSLNWTVEETEYLPIMDYKNQPIPLERITSTAVNTAIQRAITKAIARHGLGLYIYAGEDLPEMAEEQPRNKIGIPQGLVDQATQDLSETAAKESRRKAEDYFAELKANLEKCANPSEIDALVAKEVRKLNGLAQKHNDLFVLVQECIENLKE